MLKQIDEGTAVHLRERRGDTIMLAQKTSKDEGEGKHENKYLKAAL